MEKQCQKKGVDFISGGLLFSQLAKLTRKKFLQAKKTSTLSKKNFMFKF